jgi:hypothetical protein
VKENVVECRIPTRLCWRLWWSCSDISAGIYIPDRKIRDVERRIAESEPKLISWLDPGRIEMSVVNHQTLLKIILESIWVRRVRYQDINDRCIPVGLIVADGVRKPATRIDHTIQDVD